MSAADDLLARFAAIPGVQRALYSELQPADPQPVLPARRATCLFSATSLAYPVAQMYLSDAVIDDPATHDDLVAEMTILVNQYKP